MDKNSFDELAKRVSEPTTRRSIVRALRSGTLGSLLGLLGLTEAQAGKKKKKKKCRGSRKCGKHCCGKGKFCCDDARKVCCPDGGECCNVGPGSGTCCPAPNRCGKPWGNDAAPNECCPPERQWFTSVGLVRCCPTGTRSLGTGISSDDGPCCPEAKYCSESPTGGQCCGDLAPICVDRSTGRCCTEADRCGTDCCGFGQACCNGRCCPYGQSCDGGTCKCPSGVRQCGDTCCHAGAVGCDGSHCLNECDVSPWGCGG